MAMADGNHSKDVKDIGFLFDLDGVIIDSESQYTRIWGQIDSEYPTGIENFPHKIKGSTLTKILTENYPTEDLREAVAHRLHQLENEMHYSFLPHAKEFLIDLNKRMLPCVLVTSSDDMKMNHLWEELPELKDYFNYIITGNLVKTSKPSPEGYLLGASKIGRKPENCVVFEDSLQGVQAGKNAGAYVVGVIGTLNAETLAPYSHKLINNFNEIDLDILIRELQER